MAFSVAVAGLRVFDALLKGGAFNGLGASAFSPFSFFVALLLILNAADPSLPAYKETWALLQPHQRSSKAAAAKLTAHEKQLNAEVADRLRQLLQTANAPGAQLLTTNAVLTRGVNVLESYITRTKLLQTQVRKVANAKAVNSWVKTWTNRLIDRVVPDDFNDFDAMVVNAVYFNAAWEYQWNPADTWAAPFTTAGGEKLQVPTMQHTFHRDDATFASQRPVLFAAASPDFAFDGLRLPYKQSSLSAIFLLPDPAQGGNIEAALAGVDLDLLLHTERTWQPLPDSDEEHGLMVLLPRFRVQQAAISLRQAVSALGASSLFNERTGNLRRLSRQPVLLTDLMQAVTIEVNEVGTEAAAITAGGITITAAPRMLAFNRPFILLIVDDVNPDTILFMAAIKDPRSV